MNLRRKIIVGLLLLAIMSRAQPNMIVEHYSLSEGLLSNTVYCSLKDADGFVWFGTWHGLCSFDGGKFTSHVRRQNSQSEASPRKILSIAEDRAGCLWIRNVDNRLYVYDKRLDRYHEVSNELKRLSQNVQVIKVQPMDNGHVLLLTRNKSLFEAYTQPNGRVVVAKLYDAAYNINPATMRLKQNVLGATANRLFWIGKDFKIDAVERQASSPRLSSESEYTCYCRKGGNVYVGTADGRVIAWNRLASKVISLSGQQSPSAVTSLISYGKTFFATTANGCFVGGKQCLKMPHTKAVYTDATGGIWLQQGNEMLLRFHPATQQKATFRMPTGDTVAQICFADNGNNGLFILWPTGNVFRYTRQDGRMTSITDARNFIAPTEEPVRFYQMMKDREGLLWLTSTAQGVYKINFPPAHFRFLTHSYLTTEQQQDAGVRALFQQRNGDLWIANRNGGLFCVDAKSGELKRNLSGKVGTVYHIMEDHSGQLWFSTKGNGLVRATPDEQAADGYRLTRFLPDGRNRYAINSARVYYTLEDSKRRIWVCTFGGGLNLLEQMPNHEVRFHHKGNDFKTYPRYDLYLSVRMLAEDKAGRFWVGTTDGLMSFEGNFKRPADIQFSAYRDNGEGDIISSDVFSLLKDSKGDIWMGIFGGGLNKLVGVDPKTNKPQWVNYPFVERFSGNVVYSIAEDKDHWLWFCTENRLASLNPNDNTLHYYDRLAGFPQVNIEDNTSICLADGRLLIGCREGVLAFNPVDVNKESRQVYSTFLVEFRVQNKLLSDFTPPLYDGAVRYASEITLKHNQNMFTVEYATLNFTDQSKLSYTYILEGYEKQWHNSGGSRVASYANVPPGKYTFRVKALGIEAKERAVTIRILPPWWATWWAYIIYALLALALCFGAFRLVAYMIKMRNEVYVNERLAELKIRFFTNVSHELRTPLTLIQNPIGELKKHETLSKDGQEYLSLIDSNAKKMLLLVNQILDFRKVQNGKMKLHVSLCDMNSLLENFRREYAIHAKERDIAYIFEMPAEHVMAWCDKKKMGVVVNNLINNAFKYTRQGGQVCVALESDEQKQWCRIRVEDDGASIPKSQMEEIFERFSQANNHSGDTAAGTGIGLSLSREFVNMHHGTIHVENLPNEKGVAFVVEIPMGREHFAAESMEPCYDDETATNVSRGETAETSDVAEEPTEDLPIVLLIEDNVDLCRMIRLQLGHEYNLVVAHDGKAGLRKIYQYHPDVIVTDLMMPEIDGMELLRRVRNDFTVSHIPIIVLTAKQGEDVHAQVLRAGANSFITKPFSSELLRARLHQLLEEQRIFQRKMVLERTDEKGDAADAKDSQQAAYEQHLVKKDLEFVRRIRSIIEQNLQSDSFNIDALAAEAGLSRSVFFKKMKSLTGFAPVDYVREIRLDKAVTMVKHTDSNITEIAYAVGFRDSGYFTKCFRQKFGKSPKEYRADYQSGKMQAGK